MSGSGIQKSGPVIGVVHGLPQRGREVVMRRRVVVDVGRPKRSDLVVRPMEPVVAKVFGDEEERQPPPRPGDVEESKGVEPGVEGKGPDLRARVDTQHPEAHRDRRGGVPGRVAPSAILLTLRQGLLATMLEQRPLDEHGDEEEGDDVVDGVLHQLALRV